MTRRLGILLVGVVLAQGAGVARAQEVASDKPQTDLYLAVEVRHDSNVARSDPTLATQQGLVNGDERLTPTIGVLINRPLGRNALLLQGTIGYDFYRRNHRLNRERLNLSADAKLRPGFCQLELAPSYTRQQSDLSQIGYVGTVGVDSVRNTQEIQSYRAQLSCGRSIGLQPLVEYERTIADNSNQIRQVSDYRSNRYGGGVRYANPVVGDLTLTYFRTDVEYPRRAGTTIAALSKFHSDEVSLGIKRNIGSILTADANVGYVKVTTGDPNVPSFSGVSYHLGVQLEPVSRLQVRLDFAAAAKPSLGSAALYQRQHSYSGDLNYALTSRTTLTLGASRNTRNYRGATDFYGPILTDDHLTEVHGGVGMAFGQRLRLDLVGGHELRRANGTIYDYSNTYVALRSRFTL